MKCAESPTSSVYGKRCLAVRLLYLGAASLSRLCGTGRLSPGRCVVLCYHGIAAGHKDAFRRQMRWLDVYLTKQGYDRKSRQDADLPVAVTFDDAFANLLDNAIPVLEDYRIPAAVFVVTDNLGRVPQWTIAPDHPEAREVVMDADQVRDLAARPGVTVGSHTATHPDLARISEARQREELASSRNYLETLLQKKVDTLALPHGSYDDDVIRQALAAGYHTIYTLDPLPADPDQPGKAGRFSMSPEAWPMEFRLTVQGAYAWLRSWRRFIRKWKKG